MKLSRIVLTTVVLLTPALSHAEPDDAPAPASPGKVRLIANVLYGAQSLDFDVTRTPTLYAETANVAAHYGIKSGVGGDLGVQLDLGRRWAIVGSFEIGSRGDSGRLTAQLPHPLLLQHPRTVDETFSGFSYRQTAEHLSLALRGGSRAVEYTFFAGPSLFQVRTDLADVAPKEQYPYDVVTADVTKSRASKSAFGGHVGARADVRAGRHLGVGAQVRYGAASVKLEGGDVTPGGIEIGGGLRFRF